MAKETQGDKDKRLLAMLLKNVREETLRQWTEVYAAENAEFCQKTLEYLRQHCMPEMGEPDEWREKVDAIFSAECTHYHHRYSYDGTDWEKIGEEMENLFDLLSVMDEKQAFRIIHAVVSEFYRQADEESDDDFLDEGYACLLEASEKGKELLLKVLRCYDVPQEWKREVVEDMDDIRELSVYTQDEYFGLDGFAHQLSLALLPDDEAVVRLDDLIAEEPEWSAYPYIMEKERLLRKLGREEEADQFLQQYRRLPEVREVCVERLMAAGRYEEGMALIAEGLSIKEEGWEIHRVSREIWLKLQCRYAEEYNDIPRLIEGYRTLFTERGGDKELYRRLKALVPTEQWKSLVSDLLTETHRCRWFHHEILADICVEEGLYERIADFLPSGDVSRLPFISRYVRQMPQPAALLKLFPRTARSYAQTQKERTYYTILAESLKSIRSVEGGCAISDKLVAEFREQYRRRSAMMQELDKCGL